MRKILCYGDSNTYGYDPDTGLRYQPSIRWTRRLSALLGWEYELVEEGCNGRTTGYATEEEPWKNGWVPLHAVLNTNKPVDLVIFMLGTNDLKMSFDPSLEEITGHVRSFIQEIRSFCGEKQEYVPEILLAAPAVLGEKLPVSGPFCDEFDEDSVAMSRRMVEEYRKLAEEEDCIFFDANTAVQVSDYDQLHLDAEAHARYAEAIKEVITQKVRWPEESARSEDNPFVSFLKTRRSTRAYQDRPVPQDALDRIIEAGRYAPSGGNSQTTHMLVVKSRKVLDRLKEMVQDAFAAMEETPGMYKSMVNSIRLSRKGDYAFHYDAPVLIITANQKDYGNNIADCSCALENMMLAANALDLGSCWINQLKWLNEDPKILAYLKELGLEDQERVYGAVAIGYADTPDGLPVRKPLPRRGNPVTVIDEDQ